MNYGFLPEAEIEYLEAIKFYEDQLPGLGARLLQRDVDNGCVPM